MNSFFKAYDMRGTFGKDFNLDMIYRIGYFLPRVLAARTWLVGRDCRTTSNDVFAALIDGLCAAGAKITDLGLCTTPMIYFFTAAKNFDASVMITASHNPSSDNGLKISKATSLPVGYANGLNEVEKLVFSNEFVPPRISKKITLHHIDNALNDYLLWQKKATPSEDYENLKIAIDCSNGMSALFAKKFFPNAIIINDEIDGSFPAHSPNPLEPSAREQLSRTIRENNCDIGFIFDGDADRAMFLDENGDFVQPDYLIPFVAFASARIQNKFNTTIIHDIRTTRATTDALRDANFLPAMVPVGHAFAKPLLRELHALCGGELAGHYYFEEFYSCDSALLAATRVLTEVARAKKNGKTFSQAIAPLIRKFANSGELNFRIEDKVAAIARALNAAEKYFTKPRARTEIDGVRIDYDDGWFNIRPSNTEPYLRLIIECESREKLSQWQEILSAAILQETRG